MGASKWRHGGASRGHTFLCHSCGLRREFVGALINHIRAVHKRGVSAPEYLEVTDRQARDFAAGLKRP